MNPAVKIRLPATRQISTPLRGIQYRPLPTDSELLQPLPNELFPTGCPAGKNGWPIAANVRWTALNHLGDHIEKQRTLVSLNRLR
jgi:hypothetical protein